MTDELKVKVRLDMYGFIGAGNMVSAIAMGGFKSGFLTSTNCLFTDKSGQRAPQLAAVLEAGYVADNRVLASQCDVIVLGVKPPVVLEVLQELSDILQAERPLVISLAAGISLADLEVAAGAQVPVIRFMPNVNASLGLSMTALCAGTYATAEHVELATEFAGTFGECVEIAESFMPVFTALAGSSPAWIFEMIDAFAMAGVKHGLSKAVATQIVAQAFSGSASLVLDGLASQSATPNNLIDQVCSPGGTTIAGLLALRAGGAGTAIADAVAACIAQDEKLGARR
ncbi:pyrroline-5-carboxylate reductase [Gleimia sp. 6138-11-ORH1]|uniref:pyrroline-5-carboxylate reductase n=1 Tax=Gleimia sp. 6138-11-ORH1 TaxID=2973937 RepID=UPI002169F821|nr:pyrroline-5-carboxylate reductase [Gleimia sp. 6138-11-ORH1]MCS4484164.1 pyrroline-5-carboxylate reductase [Gleimia sp. 6138-11-ORH1]